MSRFKPENAFAMDPHQKSTGNALADNLVEHTSYFPSKPEASRPQIKVQPDRSSSNGEEEEAENHTMTRMLMDGNGRLCRYIQTPTQMPKHTLLLNVR